MKKQIFYFTGTGNSLSVARKINSRLQDFSLHSIINSSKLTEEDLEKHIVLVTPIYMYNIPYIVKDFITALKGRGSCSVIYAGGGEIGKCFSVVQNLFSDKEIELTSQFNIPMPSNYAPYGPTSESVQQEQFSELEARTDEICRVIMEKSPLTDRSNTGFFQTNIYPGLLYSMGYKYLKYLGKSFNVEPQCDSCGICVQVCPADNITLRNSKPSWSDQCQQCFACLQWCPKEAIQYKDKTLSTKRYRNPEVTLTDIISSNTKES